MSLLTIALDHLTLGRAALYEAVLARSGGVPPPNEDERRQDAAAPWATALRELDAAVDGLRRAGTTHHIPRALLTRAWLRFLTGARMDSTGSPQAGPGSAQEDLDEAWEIAERGPMKIFLADIHLHRARLFFGEPVYPWNQNPDGTPRGPKDDLAAARSLIQTCGYGRRLEELEDAEKAILGGIAG